MSFEVEEEKEEATWLRLLRPNPHLSLLTLLHRKDEKLSSVLKVLQRIDERVGVLCKDVAFMSSFISEVSC